MVTTFSSPLDAARTLGPEFRKRSEEIEELRRLPADIVDTMAGAGLFRFWVPEAYGGSQTPVVEGLETFVELARHDTAVAWCSFIAATTSLLAARLPPEHAEAIYGPPGSITGGFAQPVGRARVIDGGLRVTGRWQWGSGTQHCTMIGGGALLVGDDGEPAPRADGLMAAFVFFEPKDVEFLDNWHVLGVRGSGSTDYATTDAFVPEGRWADLASPTMYVDSPLYRFTLFTLLAAGVGCTAIGVADRAIEEFRTLANAKTPQNSSRLLAERTSAQTDLAKAEATVRSSLAFMLDVAGDAWDTLLAGDRLSDDQRRMMRLATTDATQRCADVVVRLHRAAGGEAVYERCALERLLRDANVVSQHAMGSERIYELVGRIGMGLPTDTSRL